MRGEQMSFIKTFLGSIFIMTGINKDDIVINDIAVSFQISALCRTSFTLLQYRPTCGALQPAGAVEFAFEALMHDATAYIAGHPRTTETTSSPDYKRMEENRRRNPEIRVTPSYEHASEICRSHHAAARRRDLGLDDGSFLACTGRVSQATEMFNVIPLGTRAMPTGCLWNV